MPDWQVIHGTVVEQLRQFAPDQFDAIVTDPPYALSFMGKDWDSFGDGLGFQKWCEAWAREALRVLKPGGYLLAFGGTRTYHREACAIEDAGFEIRDSLHWIYGSGFPKSLDVSKAIDKAASAVRDVVGTAMPGKTFRGKPDSTGSHIWTGKITSNEAATPAAAQWSGWGTALKPAHEPIILARKPLTGTVAANVLAHGTGALNIDGCRVVGSAVGGTWGGRQISSIGYHGTESTDYRTEAHAAGDGQVGRWPPNILLTHSPDCADPGPCAPDCPVAEMDRQSGTLVTHAGTYRRKTATGDRSAYQIDPPKGHVTSRGDSGGASRFFPVFRYQAKAPKRERPRVEGVDAHPTVKPLALMRWLVRLVTPPGGLVLDPFAGTGATAEAAILEGFDCVLVESEPTPEHPELDYIALINARMAKYETAEAA